MKINHKKKILFVHIPKSGGTSVSLAIDCPEYGTRGFLHPYPEEIKRHALGEDFKHFFSFAVVRNPWARYISLYNYQASDYYKNLTDGNLSSRLARTLCFPDWVRHNMTSEYKSNYFGIPQSRWWRGLNAVFKLEDRETLISELSRVMGRIINMPHENRSSGDSYEMPEALVNFIGDIDRETISLFGYEPDDDHHASLSVE